jgi:hypothetical protein
MSRDIDYSGGRLHPIVGRCRSPIVWSTVSTTRMTALGQSRRFSRQPDMAPITRTADIISVLPKALESLRRQLGVADGVLDVSVPEQS